MKPSILPNYILTILRTRVNSFGNQIIVTVFTNFLLGILGMLTGVLMARLLGPQGRGEFAAIQTWGAGIATFAMIGLPDAVVYFSSRFPRRATEYLVSAIVLLLILALPFSTLSYLLVPTFLVAQSATTILIARVYIIVFIFLYATQGMLLHPLRGQGDFVVWNLLRILPLASWLFFLIVMGANGTVKTEHLAYGFLFSLALAGIPMAYIVFKRLGSPIIWNTKIWLPMLKYSYPLALSSIPQTLNSRIDQMLIAAFLLPETLGYYAIGTAWSGVTSLLISGIAGVTFPRIAGQASMRDQTITLTRVIRVCIAISFVSIVIMWLLTPFGIPLLFGDAYTPAIQIAFILVVVTSLTGINTVLEEGVRGLGQTPIVLISEFAGLVTTLIVSFILLRQFSSLGIGLAVLLGRLVTTLILIIQIARTTSSHLPSLLLIGQEDWKLLWLRIRMTALGTIENMR